jgi:hypothetical protein
MPHQRVLTALEPRSIVLARTKKPPMTANGRWAMKRLGILAIGFVAASALTSVWSPTPQVSSQPWDTITVVAPEAKLVGDEFNADVNISEVGCPYAGYLAYLTWDNTVLAYVDPPGVTYTGLGGMTLNTAPVAEADSVRFGSARVSGTSTQTGTAATVRLKCLGTGTSLLHLVSVVEDPIYGTLMLGCDFPNTWLVDDTIACMSDTTTDNDGDGCSWYEEGFGSPSPSPGSTCTAVQPCYSDSVGYDFYDVPVPVNPDPTANGSRNAAVDMSDVLAGLRYVGTKDGGLPNPNGLDYDSIKGSCDWDADTTPDKEGLCYDRSSGAPPNPPWEAGPPNGSIDISDVLAILAQVGLNCSDPP